MLPAYCRPTDFVFVTCSACPSDGTLRQRCSTAGSAARLASAVGAEYVLVLLMTGLRDESVASLSSVADVVTESGARLAFEFTPKSPVSSIDGALDLVERIGSDRMGVMIDTWHFFRGDSAWEQLEAIPLDHLAFVQFCDALPPMSDDILSETINRRTWPRRWRVRPPTLRVHPPRARLGRARQRRGPVGSAIASSAPTGSRLSPTTRPRPIGALIADSVPCAAIRFSAERVWVQRLPDGSERKECPMAVTERTAPQSDEARLPMVGPGMIVGAVGLTRRHRVDVPALAYGFDPCQRHSCGLPLGSHHDVAEPVAARLPHSARHRAADRRIRSSGRRRAVVRCHRNLDRRRDCSHTSSIGPSTRSAEVSATRSTPGSTLPRSVGCSRS